LAAVPQGEYAYVVYTGIGRWGPKGEPRVKEGVLVKRAGKPVANLKCTGKLTTSWGRTGLQSRRAKHSEEFYFPD
jgi:hypothetical protein